MATSHAGTLLDSSRVRFTADELAVGILHGTRGAVAMRVFRPAPSPIIRLRRRRRSASAFGSSRALIVAVMLLGLALSASALEPRPGSLQHAVSGVDFTPHGTQPGLLFSLQSSDLCANCHSSNSVAQSTFRPHSTWAGSMMANATRDPLFWAAVDVANKDYPGAGEFCLRCHSPSGWYDGNVVKSGFGPPNDAVKGADGCLLVGTPDAPDSFNDFSGVGCHFCHRLMPTGPNGEPNIIGNANVWLNDSECEGNQGEPCRRGPYTYSGGFRPPHPWAQSSHHVDSRLCGSCHDVSTPDTSAGPLKTLKLADGSDTGMPFPIERTFSEWKNSAFAGVGGQTCQHCHMPNSADPAATACSGGINRTGNLAVHTFVGGNTWVPQIISGEYGDTAAVPASAGGIGRSESFERTVQWARDMLYTAADVEPAIVAYTAATPGAAGALSVRVKVTNHSGHKLPSGYAEGRRMWVNLQVRDAAGALVFESAAYNQSTAVLTRDAQARVYETLQGIWNRNGSGNCDVVDESGRKIFHFVLNDCIAKDNRIPPLGFKPATIADPSGFELRPVGLAYPDTAPGSGVLVNFDRIDYAATIPAGTIGPLTTSVRLYYQTSSREYMEFLRNQALERMIPAENLMCSGEPNRPAVVGPMERSRGEYAYQLWSGPVAGERIFAHSFDATRFQQGYGKSEPEVVATGSVSTP